MEFNVVKTSNPGLTSVVSQMRNVGEDVFRRLDNINERFMSKLSSVSNEVIETYNRSFNVLTNRTMINSVLSNISVVGGLLGNDVINRVSTTNYMNTGYRMRRYIMANPTINRYASKNRISGYGGEWVDHTPNIPPKERLDYKEVIDGSIMFDDEGMYYNTLSTNHENPLSITERDIIKNSWSTLLGMIANDEDPTEIE